MEEPVVYKGGPGPKNLKEFQNCADRLLDRPDAPCLSKYVVLVYADPTDGSRPKLRFSRQYDAYRHLRLDVAVGKVAASEAFRTSEGVVKGRLYKVKTRISG